MSYSILSPAILPEIKRIFKKNKPDRNNYYNIGDGFVLDAMKDSLKPHKPGFIYTVRKDLTLDEIKNINTTKALLLPITNRLNDYGKNFPLIKSKNLEKIEVPIILYGVGISGDPTNNSGMIDSIKAKYSFIFERVNYVSVRCSLSQKYLQDTFPDSSEKILMTSCPVIYYNHKLNDSNLFTESKNNILLTVTNRDDFWERETKTIDFIADKFKKSRKVISMHDYHLNSQVVTKNDGDFTISNFINEGVFPKNNFDIFIYALNKGFEIYIPRTVKECFQFYENFDFHLGSRLHAHLHFLSQGKKSFLTYVDDRCKGFSDDFGFPICDYRDLESYMDFDFELFRTNFFKHFSEMKKFNQYLTEDLL
ncbi:MAG: polysaccharide pyruvyl transferase family protein [Flavobacteriaceae bacterium]